MFLVLTTGEKKEKTIVNIKNVMRIYPATNTRDGNSLITFNCSINKQYGSYLANVTVHENIETIMTMLNSLAYPPTESNNS